MIIDARAARFSPPVGNDGGRDDEGQTETADGGIASFPRAARFGASVDHVSWRLLITMHYVLAGYDKVRILFLMTPHGKILSGT